MKRASLVAQTVRCLPAMWETRIWSLGQEDPLEKEMDTHSSILAWKIPWTEEPGGLQSMKSQKVLDTTERLTYSSVQFSYSVMSNSLQSHGLPTRLLFSMKFSRREYWSGLPLLSSGDLPDPGIELRTWVSCIAGRFFTIWATGEVQYSSQGWW